MISRRQAIATLAAAALPPRAYLPAVGSGAPVALPPGRPLRVVWVWPQGETLSPEQATTIRGEIAGALGYWNAHPPWPRLFVQREEAARIDDPYADWRWLHQFRLPDVITAAVVINTASRRLVDLGGGVSAPAYNWPGQATLFVSIVSGPAWSGVGVGAMLAHELGHALYNLIDGDPSEPMMGPYPEAWGRWVARGEC